LSIPEPASRRDFTVNAIYRDPLTGEIVDPHGGADDLRRKILRHVSSKFVEDPLRVLRGMQFVARFGLTPAPETIAVCRTIEPEGFPPERQFEEWAKLLEKGLHVSKGLEFLRATGWTRHYPELDALIGCKQAPEWHPEGDVWTHTCCCLDAFARHRAERVPEPDEAEDEDLLVGLAVLCHDFGKPATSRWDPKVRRIRSIGHDEAGVKPTLSFLRRLTNEERILKLVPPLVQFHMTPFAYWKSKAGDAAVRRLALKVGNIQRLIRVAQADDEGRPPMPSEPEPLEWLAATAKRLQVAASVPKPILMGRHLLQLGYSPGPQLGKLIAASFEAQLDGAFSDLEGALAHFKSMVSQARRG
jgi:tRNA nucleotidyltransferase (CCA-adding enzyme)